MYPSYWQPQQMRYIQPGNVHAGHYYPVQNQGSMQPSGNSVSGFFLIIQSKSNCSLRCYILCYAYFSAFTGYGIPPGARQMVPANSAKMQQPSQVEMPRMPNGLVPDWHSRINTAKSHPVSVHRSLLVLCSCMCSYVVIIVHPSISGP